jgi:hypothetical protein
LGVNIDGLRSYLGLNIADIVVLKFSLDLSQANAFTYLGGSQLDYLNETIIGPNGDILLAGSTRSSDFPANPNSSYDFTFGGPEDGYALQLNSALTNVITATYIGDTLTEACNALALGNGGIIVQAGYTTSPFFPVSSIAADSVYAGASEGFIVTTSLYPAGATPGKPKPVTEIRLAGNRAIYEVPAGEWQLRVFDIMGRKVYQTSLGKLAKGRYEKSLPLTEQGIYIMQLVSQQESVAGKFYFPGRN